MKKILNTNLVEKNIIVAAHCWAANRLQDDLVLHFEVENGYGCNSSGEAVFEVPYSWLINLLNDSIGKSIFEYSLKKPIESTLDFDDWNNNYTCSDGAIILERAIKDNVIIGYPTVHECNYCKDNSIFNHQ
ncbi:MAG: hypothetical protein IJ086_00615 [Clostridium sp.]|nr:hypothetical protein [Clostridium sp.]